MSLLNRFPVGNAICSTLNNMSDNSYLQIPTFKHLTRKLIKAISMPMIYGNTIINISNDIHNHFCSILDKKGMHVISILHP